MFPEKKYSTVSFKKNDTNYSVHEVFDRIIEECPQFMINGEVVRLEPFKRWQMGEWLNRSESQKAYVR